MACRMPTDYGAQIERGVARALKGAREDMELYALKLEAALEQGPEALARGRALDLLWGWRRLEALEKVNRAWRATKVEPGE